MAISINTVYKKVLALSNKEQRGYITPQEFNLLADKAQNEIYENYFWKIRTTEAKPKTQTDHADELEMLEEKLHPFHIDYTATSDDGSLTLTSMYRLLSITREGKRMTQVNKNEIDYINGNPLTEPSINRSIFVREDDNNITIYPAPTTTTSFEVTYYKQPTTPNWGYVVVNDKALYNSNTSTDFELHTSEEESLVSRILILAGTAIKQPDLQQAGAQDMQLMNQQQNS